MAAETKQARRSNMQRADWAEETLARFVFLTDMAGEDKKTQITDLLTNLHHLADRHGLEWDMLEYRAKLYHSEEIK